MPTDLLPLSIFLNLGETQASCHKIFETNKAQIYIDNINPSLNEPVLETAVFGSVEWERSIVMFKNNKNVHYVRSCNEWNPKSMDDSVGLFLRVMLLPSSGYSVVVQLIDFIFYFIYLF